MNETFDVSPSELTKTIECIKYIDERIAKDDEFKEALEQPAWQGLSDDEILEIDKSIDPKIIIGKGKTLFARAIEQALKEKNT